MSADLGNPGGPRLSNGSYPASDASGPLPPESDYPDERPPLPTPEERVADLLREYPERMNTPISEEHGRKLRESCLDDPVEELRTVDVGKNETVQVSETVARSALSMVGAVWDLLDTYEKYRDMALRMVRGGGLEADREEFLVELSNSFSPDYQSETYAKLSALKRQLLGGEYPNGVETEGSFSEPVTVLFGLTASTYKEPGAPESGFRPPADHDRAIRDAWSGSSGSVKRTLRYVLEDRLGLESEDYAWWYQSEPHPGEGAAAGYSHAHPIVVLDASAASVPASAISEETFESVVAKHIAECEGATWDGHRDAVTVQQPDEIKDFGSYVSKYLAIGPDKDLLERSDEYLLWAASQWATTSQKYSKDRTATAAVKADKCQQQYMDSEANQSVEHGETVVRSEKPGVEYECACCGSHYEIDQSADSLARMRLDASVSSAVATDGGTESEGPPESLAERWPSADAAGRVGSPSRSRECNHDENADECPLCASETEAPNHTVSGEVPIPESAAAPPASSVSEGFEREPEWEPDAVVRTWGDGEETSIGSPGGTIYGEITVPGKGSIMDRCGFEYLPPLEVFEGPEPWENTAVFSEAEVRAGEVPPPELVAREWSETVQTGRRVTAKQWPEGWYADRFERSESSADLELSESERSRVEAFVRRTGITSPPSVCGKLQIDPEKAPMVESVVQGEG
jgi:hypothetical protein